MVPPRIAWCAWPTRRTTAFGNITALRVDAAGAFLVAEQIDLGFLSPFPALRSAWFAGNAAVTGAVYRVSSEFRPAAANAANQGGVIGWLNTSASNAIVLKVVPGDGGTSLPFSFQLSHVDFTGTTPDANENLNYLFDLDGEPAANSFESAWSDPTGYQPGEFGRFELEFAAPTAEQVSVVTNATVTALVTAKVFQGAGGGTPAQIGRTIELLTTLPVPPADRHRVGYYGVWSSFFPGTVIGDYRNLTAEGQVAIQLNDAPSVTLTQPTPGTTLTAPATFSLVANASDSDGTIAAVEFFEGANSLGRVTAPPFVWSWSGVTEGSYQLTAVATDNLGEATTSEPVGVTVVPFSGTAPTLNVEVEGDTIHLAWSGSGFQLQYKTSVGARVVDRRAEHNRSESNRPAGQPRRAVFQAGRVGHAERSIPQRGGRGNRHHGFLASGDGGVSASVERRAGCRRVDRTSHHGQHVHRTDHGSRAFLPPGAMRVRTRPIGMRHFRSPRSPINGLRRQ